MLRPVGQIEQCHRHGVTSGPECVDLDFRKRKCRAAQSLPHRVTPGAAPEVKRFSGEFQIGRSGRKHSTFAHEITEFRIIRQGQPETRAARSGAPQG
ncbi:hypothetical protein SDC9_125230 [bioreactor metagenome]|uniref:Uncharacterized protein n=1 Tax=bioreactor metagenome TaxID=1076179 RepID=A0A645CMT7_9ZZZZ